jgi:hypothetical protein
MLNRKIISVQTDWGSEYEWLNSFFRTIGISHRVSSPHAHQQNGAAECKYRHIVEVGLALLAKARMPLKYWDQAFLAATHLINLTPSKRIDYDTPLHRLLGATLDYSNLHIFDCACWPNLCPYNTHKFQFRSMCCVFLGYSNLHKDYKCLDVSSGHAYISHDIVFDESVFLFAELHPNAGAQYTSEVLLLPKPSPSQDNSDLSMDNAKSVSCLPCSVLSPQFLQPQRIPRCVPVQSSSTNSEGDSASGAAPTDSLLLRRRLRCWLWSLYRLTQRHRVSHARPLRSRLGPQNLLWF